MIYEPGPTTWPPWSCCEQAIGGVALQSRDQWHPFTYVCCFFLGLLQLLLGVLQRLGVFVQLILDSLELLLQTLQLLLQLQRTKTQSTQEHCVSDNSLHGYEIHS